MSVAGAPAGPSYLWIRASPKYIPTGIANPQRTASEIRGLRPESTVTNVITVTPAMVNERGQGENVHEDETESHREKEPRPQVPMANSRDDSHIQNCMRLFTTASLPLSLVPASGAGVTPKFRAWGPVGIVGFALAAEWPACGEARPVPLPA